MSQSASTPADQATIGYAQSGTDGLSLRQRFAGIAATLLAEIVIIALLLTLGWNLAGEEPDPTPVVTFEARNVSDAPPAAPEEPIEEASEQQPEPTPQPPDPEPVEVPELPEPPPLDPPPLVLPTARPSPPPPPPRPRPRPTPRPQAGPPAPAYGPPDTGPSYSSNDSVRVGTAPNGEPMYAARWYREPTDQELAGYLSTATPPSSALIVCRTVPDFYVEDCELLGENPRGSQIGRAALAAAWQFRVRPAVIGGRSQVGSWVRIRIDYTIAVRR
ncbi:MAG: hypothetical protein AAFR64_09855 [Pseudomonadota bacterium]